MSGNCKLTALMIKKISGYLREGLYINTACDLAGVNRRSYSYWMEKGETAFDALEDGEEISVHRQLYVDAYNGFRKARAEFERDLFVGIGKKSGNNFQADAWRLERTRPEKYSRRDRFSLDANLSLTGPLMELVVSEHNKGKSTPLIKNRKRLSATKEPKDPKTLEKMAEVESLPEGNTE